MEEIDCVAVFGFDPKDIGNRYRSYSIECAESVGDDAPLISAGFLCVRTRDGGGNPMDYKAIKKDNFVHTREDDFDVTYRYYWFKPLP